MTQSLNVIVWSKEQCPHCVQAKQLLTSKNIQFEERKIGEEWTREQLLEAIPNARTVPQIVINEQLIGGFTELRTHLAATK